MYVQIGSYQHAAAEAGVIFSTEKIRTARGDAARERKRLVITGKLLPTAGEDNMTTAITNLENAYVDGYSCGLYQTDGTQTTHFLDNGTSLGGVRVVSRSFPNPEEVYSTNRSFAVTLEADYPILSGYTISYVETIQLIGDGGRFGRHVRLVQGRPDAQILSTHTECRATQSGTWIHSRAHPTQPGPLWPPLVQGIATNISLSGPVKVDGYYTNYTTRWSYQFIGNEPFFGVPNWR